MSAKAWVILGLLCWTIGITGLIIMTGSRVVCP
jgi:hypothetical protein